MKQKVQTTSPCYYPVNLIREDDVKSHIQQLEQDIIAILEKYQVELPQSCETELKQVLQDAIDYTEDMPPAEITGDQLNYSLNDLTWQDRDKILNELYHENKDEFKKLVVDELESEGFISFKCKDSFRMDKLKTFIESELYPYYNERVEYCPELF